MQSIPPHEQPRTGTRFLGWSIGYAATLWLIISIVAALFGKHLFSWGLFFGCWGFALVRWYVIEPALRIRDTESGRR